MYQLIFVIHVLTAICLIALVLVQQGRGATVGAAFGSGASQTIFGSRGSGSVLLKITISFVVIFFSTSIVLNYMASKAIKHEKALSLPVPIESPVQQPAPKNLPANLPTGPVTEK